MKYISLFSGIEGASVAWKYLGFQPLAFSEVDAFPNAVLAHRFPEVPNLGDITKIDWTEYKQGDKRPDIIIAGSPCQSFSLAGNRKGLRGASGLMWEYIRCVREIMPRYTVWENVPGVLSSSYGGDFRCLLASLDELGYCVSWRVLDSQFFGLPQRRERVYVVGSLRNASSASILFDQECLSEPIGSSRSERKRLANRSEETSLWSVCGNVIGRKPQNGGHQLGIVDPDENGMFTLTATDRHAIISSKYGVRKITPLECERLQGFPDYWTDVPYKNKESPSDAVRYKALGNSMAVPVIRWIGRRIKHYDVPTFFAC